ncbi:hypothetical protein GCM10008090_31490 [Arenicella chitinivorans]|uniref:Uncharacterized protein n=1 Tax=Arenicella chitinivorans TaxID=1329800 RepID=A0A918VQF7_9GAMM|nr:hypothetical protein GCM10008090_31490 [Arenicella chitinivorans]
MKFYMFWKIIFCCSLLLVALEFTALVTSLYFALVSQTVISIDLQNDLIGLTYFIFNVLKTFAIYLLAFNMVVWGKQIWIGITIGCLILFISSSVQIFGVLSLDVFSIVFTVFSLTEIIGMVLYLKTFQEHEQEKESEPI